MNRHYSSSKFVKWLRKKVFRVAKPTAMAWGDWDEWESNLKSHRPVAYFFTETLPDALQWVPEHSVDYVNDFRYYIQNRVQGSHRLDSNLKKGTYHELGTRMLHSMFDSYIDFIEIEEAWVHVAWENKEERKKYNLPWWRRHWILRWGKQWRCPQAGTDHLKWEMSLEDSPHQKESAYEKMELYTWWKYVRPQRKTEWEETGMDQFFKSMDEKYGSGWGFGSSSKLDADEELIYRTLQQKDTELEEQRHEEDTQMLIRLIKLRRDLWT